MQQFTDAHEKSRLLLLIPELLTGGAARVVQDHASAFAPYFIVQEAVFDLAQGMDFAGDRKVLSLDDGSSSGPLRPLLNLLRRTRRLRRIKRSLSIDVTMSHLDGAHRVSILSGGNDLKILVVHGSIAHDQTIRGLKGLLTKRLLVPWLYNRADILVTVSRELVGELATLGVDREKIVTINNIIDAPAIRSNAALAIPDHDHVIFKGRPTLITTGRLHPQKNPIGLLQAFAQLLQSRSARLLSLGDGPLRKAAVECAEALGLRTAAWWRGDIPDADHDVHFLGPRRNPFPYLRAADLFVLPSLWEGFPLSLCEALACGVPSIAADCPTGPREILAPSTAAPHRLLERPETGEFGMLMPLLQGSASAEVWAKSFVGLLDDEATRGRLSRAGMRRIEDFSASRILPQWLTLIERLSDSRR